MTEGKFDFVLDGIAHQLEDRLLTVPIYQRSYAWQTDHVNEFWTDLNSAFAQPQPAYFLGTIVLSKEGPNGRDTVIDGQQRLATTAVLLSAIRDEYRARGDEPRASIVQNSYLAKEDLETGEAIPQLRLNSEDSEYFRALIIDGQPPASLTKLYTSHELIRQAQETLRQHVTQVADDAGVEWVKRLSQWVSFLRNSVQLIVVQVSNDADAFLIFETLNDRGADLTIADLLKNYLFGRAGSSLHTVRGGWLTALGTLGMSAENAQFTTFLRHYWSSRHGAVRERDLYRRVKERVTTESQATDFIIELQKASRLYAAILNSSEDFWSELGSTVRDNVDTLLRFDLEQNRPLLLAAMQHFSAAELKRVLRAIVAWAVRGVVVGGIGGGTTERTFCEAAVRIRSGEVKTADELLPVLSAIIPSDDEFRAAFSVARVPRPQLARYYLLALEKAQSGKPEPELVPNANEDEVNLEHILPRNASTKDWGQFTADERQDYLHRLGNLTLLSKGPNGRIGNKAFTAKKPILAASELQLTKQAGASVSWTPNVIHKRQAEFANLAVKVWPREP
jgi:hypothetical protein